MKATVDKIYLASSSSFRQKLLASSGVLFTSVSPAVEEGGLLGESPEETAAMRGHAKAQAVAAKVKSGLVIGSDQVLAFAGRILTKPKSQQEALSQLRMLAGKRHTLFTSLALLVVDKDGVSSAIGSTVVKSELQMRALDEASLKAYADTGEWQGCVGGYRIEEKGANLFELPEGHSMPDSTSVMGLPLVPLLNLLRTHNVDPLLNPHGPWDLSFEPIKTSQV